MDFLFNNKFFKRQERVRFALSQPSECRPMIKEYFQCTDYFQYNKKQSASEAEKSCVDYDYTDCLIQNNRGLFDNKIFNVNTIKRSSKEDEE